MKEVRGTKSTLIFLIISFGFLLLFTSDESVISRFDVFSRLLPQRYHMICCEMMFWGSSSLKMTAEAANCSVVTVDEECRSNGSKAMEISETKKMEEERSKSRENLFFESVR